MPADQSATQTVFSPSVTVLDGNRYGNRIALTSRSWSRDCKKEKKRDNVVNYVLNITAMTNSDAKCTCRLQCRSALSYQFYPPLICFVSRFSAAQIIVSGTTAVRQADQNFK